MAAMMLMLKNFNNGCVAIIKIGGQETSLQPFLGRHL